MGSERRRGRRRRGSVRPWYKAGILGMEMLPLSPLPSKSRVPVSSTLHWAPRGESERVPASLSTKRAREQYRLARGLQVRIRRRCLL